MAHGSSQPLRSILLGPLIEMCPPADPLRWESSTQKGQVKIMTPISWMRKLRLGGGRDLPRVPQLALAVLESEILPSSHPTHTSGDCLGGWGCLLRSRFQAFLERWLSSQGLFPKEVGGPTAGSRKEKVQGSGRSAALPSYQLMSHHLQQVSVIALQGNRAYLVLENTSSGNQQRRGSWRPHLRQSESPTLCRAGNRLYAAGGL